MGQMLDFVPNHVGVGDDRNAWWMDVLENGPTLSMPDIEWQPLKTDLRNKVLLPILGGADTERARARRITGAL